MSTNYRFTASAIQDFELNGGAPLNLTKSQLQAIDENQCTSLTTHQLLTVYQNMIEGQDIANYLDSNREIMKCLSVTLYVFNDALWNIMERKSDSVEKMLAMSTIPWIYWSGAAVSKENPDGTRLESFNNTEFDFDSKGKIYIRGSGGDFCGFLEAQVAGHSHSARPIFSPTLPGKRNLVPKYELNDLAITINLDDYTKKLYPQPRKDLDYSYSEHPRVFYEHGFGIDIDGANVILKVGRKKPQKMLGKVLLLIGRPWDENPSHDVILYHALINGIYNSI